MPDDTPNPLGAAATVALGAGAIIEAIPPALDLLAHFLIAVCAPNTIAYKDSVKWLTVRGKTP